MKIKLQITMPDGAVRSLEMRKPEVGIGRNPASPVTFAGDEAKGVSWDHATIRVDGNKISVADAASSNGTLLNDAMMPPHVPVALKVKDCIQLGYTGPKIVLLAFDPGEERFTAQTLIAAYGARRDAKSSERSVSTSEPSAKATAPAAAKGRRPLWPFVGGGVAVILIAVAGIFAFGGKREKVQPKAPEDENRKSMAYLSLGSFGELGAMGEKAIEAICDVLESTQQSDDTRRAALFAMQVWLARSSKHLPLLMYTVTVRKQRYSAVDADQILRLAIEAAEADRASPALYQGWIAALESPRPAIRFLAWERLKRALGEEKAAAIPNSYHPNKSPKDPDQAKAIAQWHQLIPPGWVPPKTATR
jgi:hypothetical protein